MDNEKRIRKFLGATVSYDNNGQYFFAHIDDTIQVVAGLRGWGAIQHLFAEHKEAAKFQDELGEWIADAINQKLHNSQSECEHKDYKMSGMRKSSKKICKDCGHVWY